MLSFGTDPEFPKLIIHLGHVIGNPVFNCSEVMVVHLLTLGTHRSKNSSACQFEIRSGVIEFPVYQEVLLLRT